MHSDSLIQCVRSFFTVSTMHYIYFHHIKQRLFWFYLLGTCKKLAKSTVIWFVLAYIMYFVTFSRPGTRFAFSDTHISGHLINFHSAFTIKTFILFNSYLLTLRSSCFFIFCFLLGMMCASLYHNPAIDNG